MVQRPLLIEDLDTIEHGLASGSWVETGLGVLAGTLDAISTIVNPLEAVVSWGVAWLIEHFEPLSDALEVLAGDADQIMAFSQTWSNVAGAITAAGVSLRAAIDRETIDWTGAGGRGLPAAHERRARGDGEPGQGRRGARPGGARRRLLVSCVRQMVRDADRPVCRRARRRPPQWLAEEGVTLGLATPVVIGQAAALVGKWIARVRTLLMALVRSIRNLMPILRNLNKIINALVQLIKRLARTSPGATPKPTGPTVRPPRRFTQQEVDDIVRHLAEEGTPQPGHAPPGGHGPRAVHGEQGMGFHYSQEKGWAFLDGPSGTGRGGHPWNARRSGRVRLPHGGPFEMHILDNKSYASDDAVGKASALTDTLPDRVRRQARAGQRPEHERCAPHQRGA